ncbi:hypothetical protein ABZX30_23200 [Streptomyces sp. NPDC004542]|uniref:hypothetical protein n=1 Tax=Streptomyces sp. NPDC004542 TaxID=3154281 RepID=UPI0033ACEA40
MAGNSFQADPHRTRVGAKLLEDIARDAHEFVTAFAGHRNTLTGWAGDNDDYAQQVGPQIRKTYRQTMESGRQVIEAIVSVVDQTAGSATHVERARDEAFEGVAAEQAEYGGRH